MKENCWKDIFDAMPFACLVLEPKRPEGFTILDVNQAYLELTGSSLKDLVKKDTKEAFPPNPNDTVDRHNIVMNSLIQVLETGEKQIIPKLRYDIPVRGTENYEQRYFTTQNIPLKNSSGDVTQILHTTRDITLEVMFAKREKDFEAELTINRQQFNNFIRENPDGLYRMDLQGNFLHLNDSLVKMIELPVEKIINTNFLPYCAPYHKAFILEKFAEACSGKVTSFEADFFSALGRKTILKILLMPMFLDGKVGEIHGIAKDITAIRKSEKVLIEKSRFLEVNATFISSLLENEINDEALYEAFGAIAKTVEADRMYYFGADKDSLTGEILVSQKVEWCSEKAVPQMDNPQMQNMPIQQIEEIMAPLTKNLPFIATLQDLAPGSLKDIFVDQNIKSMLLLPIFVEERLYGFVGFDDCVQQRTWNEDEISFLKSLTQNLTNAFEKKAALDKAKKSEEELKQSEQKFRALVQEGSDLIGILNEDGFYSFVSENYKDILGLAPAELVGENAFQLIHPEDRERVKEQFLQLKEQKQVRILPFRFRNKENGYSWVQTTATNLLEDSAVQGIVANSRDITTVVEQAREIEQINERYQLAATATEDLIYDWDLSSNEITRFHKSRKEFFGYPSEIVDRTEFWEKNMHPEDFVQEKRKLYEALQNSEENYIKTEYRFRRADGTYAQVIDKGYILRDQSKKAIRIIGAASDITEITEQKEALRVANQRFEMAMKATNEMIWDWDVATDSVTRSKGYKNIFGYNTNEATSVQSFWLDKVHEEDREKVQLSLAGALGDPKVKKWKLEYRFHKADGKVAYIHDQGYILRDEYGKATRLVGAVMDVTKSMKLLRKIQRQNKALKEIAWEQSHVVRAPLARILGLLHLLEQEQFEEMSKEEVLYHIKNSANELDGIIHNIVGKTENIEVEVE